ncbi:MAG: transglutaminase family protein, partial [Candidatus Dormibacteraeota bacterium]|nr:transglutaminase family protein [Candidatus Dormibacteraeota bacterium]
MAHLAITHLTRLTYREPIAETYMEMRVRPLDGVGQRCTEFKLDVKPSAPVHGYRDGFGNHVLYFNHLPEHNRVEVRARSQVETGVDGADPEWQVFPEDFLAFRPPVLDLPGVRRIAAVVDQAGRPEESLVALTSYINSNFQYRREITNVFTQVDEVLRLRSGVCQDFAHLFIAVGRSLDIPCRYVSGYIDSRGGIGAGATHA